MDCIFCKIINNEIPAKKIRENDKFIALLDINPISKGHTLLIPKNHHDYVFTMEDNHYQDFFLYAKKIAPILQEYTACKKVGLLVEGFLVNHVHIHLIPLHIGGEISSSTHVTIENEEFLHIQNDLRNKCQGIE